MGANFLGFLFESTQVINRALHCCQRLRFCTKMRACPGAPALAALADHPVVVLAAYLTALYPFMTQYTRGPLLGRSTPALRRGQWCRIILSLPAVIAVSFYAHLQNIVEDYTEMCAAAVTVLWCVLNIGLHAWCLGEYYWGRLKIEWRNSHAPEAL